MTIEKYNKQKELVDIINTLNTLFDTFDEYHNAQLIIKTDADRKANTFSLENSRIIIVKLIELRDESRKEFDKL